MNPHTQLLNSKGLRVGGRGIKSSQSEKLPLKILTCKLISTISNVLVTLMSKRELPGESPSKGKCSKRQDSHYLESKEVTTKIT